MGVEIKRITPGDGKASRSQSPARTGSSRLIITADVPQERRYADALATRAESLLIPAWLDKVQIHYVGTLADGSKFDSSRDRNKPFETAIGVGKVIKGWDEGVPQLSLGEKAVLTISPDYGYGARGYPPVIPPNSTLTFEVELLRIN